MHVETDMSDSGNHAGGERDGEVRGRRPRHPGRPADGDGRGEYAPVACDFTARTCTKCGSALFMLFGSGGAGVDGRPAVMITCENCMDASILTICKISSPFPMTRDMSPIASTAE